MEPLELTENPVVQAYIDGYVLGRFLAAGGQSPPPPYWGGERGWAYALGLDDGADSNRPRAARDVLQEVEEAFAEADPDEEDE
jgi:hypothetical protein